MSKFGIYLLQFINDLPCYGQLLRGGNNRIIIVEVVISPSGAQLAVDNEKIDTSSRQEPALPVATSRS